ncbi:ABC transporter permease [Microbacterium sp. A204]|uniref:ABC transporter permease n=1 Tax=Microbacterium sp. A204 TaxID=3457321 RepID=UPI003FD68D8F
MNRIIKSVSRERELTVLIVMILITAIFVAVVAGSRFYSPGNFQSMAVQVSEFGFLALAMGLAMLTGGIDLSIVAAATLSGIVGATVLSGAIIPIEAGNGGMLIGIAIVATLVTALLCGLLNGFLIAKLSVPPILATLATMILFSGIGMVITKGQSVAVLVPGFSQLSVVTVAGIPLMFVVMLLGFIALGFFLRYSRQGRRIYLFGENSVALKFSGVKTERTILLTYAVVGLLVGFAALVMIARVNSARVGFGESYLLQAILVVVLAGFNPYGGRGRVVSILLALVLLQFLQSAFTMMAFTPFAKNMVWGGMLLFVMVINFTVARLKFGGSPKPPRPASTETENLLVTTGVPK